MTQGWVYVWPVWNLAKEKAWGKDKRLNQKAVVVHHMAFENVLHGEFMRDGDWIVLDDSWHFNEVVQSHSAIFYAFAYSAYIHMHTRSNLMLLVFIYTKKRCSIQAKEMYSTPCFSLYLLQRSCFKALILHVSWIQKSIMCLNRYFCCS